MSAIEQLTILYDAECGFCCRCREWLERNEGHVKLELIPRESPEVARRFPDLRTRAEDELVVIDDSGGVYRGPDAFIMCLYALDEYRGWALRFGTPSLRPLARRAFELVSAQRHRINDWLKLKSDADVARALEQHVGLGTPHCAR